MRFVYCSASGFSIFIFGYPSTVNFIVVLVLLRPFGMDDADFVSSQAFAEIGNNI